MDVLNLKIDGKILREIDQTVQDHRYSTRSEFVRDAIREKLSELETEKMLRHIEKTAGSSKRKTTDEALHRAGEKVMQQLAKRFRG